MGLWVRRGFGRLAQSGIKLNLMSQPAGVHAGLNGSTLAYCASGGAPATA